MRKGVWEYVLAAAIGAAVSIVIGYLVYATPGDSVRFGYWIWHPIRYSVFAWVLGGMLVGLGLRRLTTK